jgi:hypothetical protein
MTKYDTPQIVKKSFTDANEFAFKCPIFKVDVKFRDCAKLQQLHMRHDKPNVRKGCQACLTASKCPISHMIKELHHEGDGRYFSAEPSVGPISDAVIARTARILVMPFHTQQYNLTDREKELIEDANEMARQGVVTKQISRRKTAASETSTSPKISTLTAETGDMSAAINKEMEKQNAL